MTGTIFLWSEYFHFWYLRYILGMILIYFYVSNVFNAEHFGNWIFSPVLVVQHVVICWCRCNTSRDKQVSKHKSALKWEHDFPCASQKKSELICVNNIKSWLWICQEYLRWTAVFTCRRQWANRLEVDYYTLASQYTTS